MEQAGVEAPGLEMGEGPEAEQEIHQKIEEDLQVEEDS